MANRFQIPREVEARLRKKFKVYAYCGRRMKAKVSVTGDRRQAATIEHLNRFGPFYWSDGLQEFSYRLHSMQFKSWNEAAW
jgi:hypothetical protein